MPWRRNTARRSARHHGDGDLKAVLAFYTDDAYVVWPGAGQEAHGKAAIEKLATSLCDPNIATKPALKSVVGVQLDPTHIAIVGHWDLAQNGPDGKPATVDICRTSIHLKSEHGWRYVIDHASIGMPPPPPAK